MGLTWPLRLVAADCGNRINERTGLDLSSLRKAIASLEGAIEIVSDSPWFDRQPANLQNTLIAGVIQNFEFVYELSIKMLRRRIEINSSSPAEIDGASFRTS